MNSGNERKLNRLNSGIPDTLSQNAYNAVIGACLIWGFLINAVIVWLCGDFFAEMDYIIFIIGYFVLAFLGVFLSAKSTNAYISFLGYNLVVVPIGAVLAVCLPEYAYNEILLAIIVTGAVVGFMTVFATTNPRLFERMGASLALSLICGLVCEVIAILLGYSGNLFNWLFVIIFSLYIGYDWHKAQSYSKTVYNAIDSAIDLYLDLINLFDRILDLLDN